MKREIADDAEGLTEQLLSAPEDFSSKGMAYQLLQFYFSGYEAAHLRPLLAHDHPLVRRAAVWIASELGSAGCELSQDVLGLLKDDDRHTRYYAMDVLAICAESEFFRLVEVLRDDDKFFRKRAMELLARASTSQLQAAFAHFSSAANHDVAHAAGLSRILGKLAEVHDGSEELADTYRAIAASRFNDDLEHMADLGESADEAVREFVAGLRKSRRR